MATRRRNNKSSRRRRQTQRNRLAGGALRVYYGKITDVSGKKTFTNSHFLRKGNGFNAHWHTINDMLTEHVGENFTEDEIESVGFGGDDGSGYVVVKSKKPLKQMPFTIDRKEYIMTFDRFENEE